MHERPSSFIAIGSIGRNLKLEDKLKILQNIWPMLRILERLYSQNFKPKKFGKTCFEHILNFEKIDTLDVSIFYDYLKFSKK